MVKYQKHPTSSKEGYAYFWSLNTDIDSVAELAGEKKNTTWEILRDKINIKQKREQVEENQRTR